MATYPKNELSFQDPAPASLTAGKQYEGYAVSVYQGVVFVLIDDDLQTIRFYPRSLFEVVDPSIPTDWICNTFPDGPVQLVMGPPYIAKDLQAYEDMVDSRRHSVDEFAARLRAANRAAAEGNDE